MFFPFSKKKKRDEKPDRKILGQESTFYVF